MMQRLKHFAESLEKNGLLERIAKPVSTDFECARILKQYDGKKAVFFEKPLGYRIPIIGNVVTNRNVLYSALGVRNDEEAFSKLLNAMSNPQRLKVEGLPSTFRRFESIETLPVLRSFEGEAGRYITSGIVIAREPGGETLNASIHRMLVLDRKHLAIRIVPRHLYSMYTKARKEGADLPVAVVIGAPPEVYIAAAASPPYGVFELEVANALAKGSLAAFEVDGGLPVPLNSEIVLVGRIRADLEAPEGPFVDITGTLDEVRSQPVLEVDHVLVAEDAYYYAILQSGQEHILLMGFPREAAIWDSVRRVVPRAKAVRLIPGGCGWLIAVISIAKNVDGDAKNAIISAFAAHPSLKIAIAVDEDIDVDDPNYVLWALATRMQPHEDLMILTGLRGSSLDPSADQVTLSTSKLGIDATIPLNKKREAFLKAHIP
jgi:UbiD family decarboxylase